MEDYIRIILIKIPPILLALTFHEFAHGWTARKLGDNTAYMLGRVTLNPVRHLDAMGTLAFVLTGMFGWAKPVPVNPMNFRNPSKGMMLVSIAGPGANILLAVLAALVYKLMFLSGFAYTLTRSSMLFPLFYMVQASIVMNVALAIFNMIPVPPLDGSRVLAHFLPADKAIRYSSIEPYGFMILLALIFTGLIGRVLFPLVTFTVNVLTRGGL